VTLRGFDSNILTQLGLLVLVALASKNAILIVEFARQAEEQARNLNHAPQKCCGLPRQHCGRESIAAQPAMLLASDDDSPSGVCRFRFRGRSPFHRVRRHPALIWCEPILQPWLFTCFAA
jgi:hypothetical protein